MESTKKKSQKTTHSFEPKRSKRYNCTKCQKSFNSLSDFKDHVRHNFSCRSGFCCNFCPYIGYNEVSFNFHLQSNSKCRNSYNESQVATGVLPYTFESIQGINTSQNSKSFRLKNQYHEETDNQSTIVTIKDRTEERRVKISNKSTNVNNYLDISRTVAGINNNQPSSTFELTSNGEFETNSNLFFVDVQAFQNSRKACTFTGKRLELDSDSIELDFDKNNSCDNSSVESNNPSIEDQHDNQDQQTVATSTQLHSQQYSRNLLSHNCPSQEFDITNEQDLLQKHFTSLTFTPHEHILMDLYHILKASNTPLIVFDRIITWLKKHDHEIKSIDATNLSPRHRFIIDLNHKLYQDKIVMKPLVNPIYLSSGRQTNVVTFSFKEIILKIVTNKSLFCPDNLLLDPKDPCKVPTESDHYGEVNTGSWWKEAIQNECKEPNHILMPFCHFIDGLKIDKYGKLSVEAVLSCCLWFNRKARNRSSTWHVQGFIQDQTMFHNQDGYVRDDRAQDYHDMMAKIFQEMKEIYDNGGIKLVLDFGNGYKHTVIAIPVIQFIIGDCKGNDLLCGRKGGHHLNMKGLCRDCNISPKDGDKISSRRALPCKFHSIDTIVGRSKAELDKYSFLPIRNCFTNISFGGCRRNIYGATPAEILHAVLLGLCQYITDSMELIFTESSMYLISNTAIKIYEISRRQSERDLPDMGPFKKGLFSVKSLKAKERFARLYCIFLALCNSYLIKELMKKKRKRTETEPSKNLTLQNLRDFKTVVEDTLLFYLWMKKETFPKSDFEVKKNQRESRALRRIKSYLRIFKKNVIRGGNGLRTPKFHQMLHVVDYIKRHGSPINYDGSRGENFGKILIKDNAKLTNKQKETLNFDIGRRISEEDIINKASNIFHENIGLWPSEYCSEIDLMSGSEISHSNETRSSNTVSLHKFRLRVVIEDQQNSVDNSVSKLVDVNIDWTSARIKEPLFSFKPELLRKVAARLFLGSPNIGGKIDPNNSIPGYTHIVKDDIIYRANPCYFKKGCWYDWAYFEWDGFSDPIPGRIMMILDLSDTEILYRDQANDSTEDHVVHHLTKEIWLVILAAVTPKASQTEDLSDMHFDSSIITRVKLHDDNEVYMVPLSTLAGPCFVVYNQNYTSSKSSNSNVIDDRTAYVVKPMREWGDEFLPSLN